MIEKSETNVLVFLIVLLFIYNKMEQNSYNVEHII